MTPRKLSPKSRTPDGRLPSGDRSWILKRCRQKLFLGNLGLIRLCRLAQGPLPFLSAFFLTEWPACRSQYQFLSTKKANTTATGLYATNLLNLIPPSSPDVSILLYTAIRPNYNKTIIETSIVSPKLRAPSIPPPPPTGVAINTYLRQTI